MKKNNIDKILEEVKKMDALMLYQLKQFLIDNIIELSSSNGTNAKVIQDNCNEMKMCPVCNNILSKNGHTKSGVQKYVCSSCRKTLSSTTNTLTYYSKLSFEIWKNQISDFFDGLSLRRTAEKNNISTTSAFNTRHKILNLIHDFIENIKLRERAQLDEKYIKINLKGTKPENMPRYSKRRKSSGSAGLNKHLVCIAGGVDSNDNIILKIVGLGKVSTEMLREAFTNKLERGTEVITDGDTAYRKLCEENGTKLIAIPSKNILMNMEIV